MKAPAIKREYQDTATRLLFQEIIRNCPAEKQDLMLDMVDKCFPEYKKHDKVLREHYRESYHHGRMLDNTVATSREASRDNNFRYDDVYS